MAKKHLNTGNGPACGKQGARCVSAAEFAKLKPDEMCGRCARTEAGKAVLDKKPSGPAPEAANDRWTPRKGTKAEKAITLLSRPTGATVEDFERKFGWQHHTSRSFLATLRKRGYRVDREEKVYRLAA